MQRSLRRLAVLAVVVAAAALGGSATAANAIRRSSSFVVPTRGSAHSLTLTTYVTDAADLHYAAVVAGHAPLEAAAIKSAAQRCDATRPDPDPHASRGEGPVEASTVVVHRAQKLERMLDGLQANTSYDVYFVAEVPNSNGVFGQVLSVLGTATNPTAPSVGLTAVAATNGSATSAVMNMSLSSPGIVHVAFVPSMQDVVDSFTADDVVAHNSRGVSAVFTTETRFGWDSLSTPSTVEGLTPAIEYDVLLVTEALGHGSVFSKLHREKRAVQTHAAAPDVIDVMCLATNGSSSKVDLSFGLQFSPEDLSLATEVTLDRYQYVVHYEVYVEASNGTARSTERGEFQMKRFSSIEELHREAESAVHTYTITGLEPGTDHDITLRVETVGSDGVLGQAHRVERCRTHATAPHVVKANAQPMNGTVDAIRVDVEISRHGNVHYILAPRSASPTLRKLHHQLGDLGDVSRLIQASTDDQQLWTGVVQVNESDTSGSFARTLVIEGLGEDTPYSIIVVCETIGSFGVFGKPYDSLLEATTYEHASEVSVISVRPTRGSITSVDVQLGMTKPTDVLFACWRIHDGGADECREVSQDELEVSSQSPQAAEFIYRAGNLSEDCVYDVTLYAESHLRNGVRGPLTDRNTVRTYRHAPELISVNAQAVDARVDALQLHIKAKEPGRVHYAVALDVEQIPERRDSDEAAVEAAQMPVELIVSEEYLVEPRRTDRRDPRNHSPSRTSHDSRHIPSQILQSQSSWSVIKRGQALLHGNDVNLLIEELQSNTTYSIYVVVETAYGFGDANSSSSGVFGLLMHANAATHDVAPLIVKAAAGATANRTDSVVITVNVSRPGIIHYHITDTDFADPAAIKNDLVKEKVAPHTLRGSFTVTTDDMAMQIKNGTNDTEPMVPLVFANNFTVANLHEATTYHVSLTTETLGSNGVFGEFPAPILVTTHESPPHFLPNSLSITPIAGSSTSVSIQFCLDKLGDVHYAVFFRGIVRDLTTDSFEIEEQKRMEEQEVAAQAHAEANKKLGNSTKAVEFVRRPRWPPPMSMYDLAHLTPRAVKDASLEELDEGVWENGTISVSRDDIIKMKLTEKKLEKLPPNAMFDVCLAPETAASDGIFAPLTCTRVITHADYSNQSMMFDEVHATPLAGASDAVHIELFVSKKLDAPESTGMTDTDLNRLKHGTGRVPYFVLIDGHEGRSEFSHNNIVPHSHRHDRTVSPFKTAAPGRGNVVAAGILDTITFENDSFVVVEHTVTGLRDNHRYFFFFAYETAGSDGVFTVVNPHKHRPNETNSRHPDVSAIEVTTLERAPTVKRYEAEPTYGDTSRITVKMDFTCASREEVILHLIVLNKDCPVLPTIILLPTAGPISTIEMTGQPNIGSCEYPLIYRRVDVNMTERSGESRQHHHHHSRHHHHDSKSHSIEEEIRGDGVLQQNTTYQVLVATETFNSSGVVSDKFEVARVTTSPVAPRFNQLRVQPRKGSTTELLIVVELDHPGEVHYMLGKSGNPELNVTSSYNVSAKSLPGQRDSKFHDYGRDVVRSRRTIKMEAAKRVHVEVVDYLVAGTAYDVFVVAETAGDNGIYGDVLSFVGVSTVSTPPMLLAHTAYPTPKSVDSLSIGFRVEEDIPCVVHLSVITSSPWGPTSHVASGSDIFGNRLALNDRFIGRSSIAVDIESGGSDDGWREVNVSVPFPGTNYTIFLVTETRDSDGVFGTVASHHNVRSHREPPTPLNVSVRPTDARVDAVTVDVVLSHDEGGHIHFAVLRHRQRFSRSAITKIGRIDVLGANSSSFIIDGLQGRTTYDVYLRFETLDSGGVISEWTPFPVTATTHGLPAEVLESVECDVFPTCDSIGRQPCSRVANVCGDCQDGFDGAAGSANTPCRPLEPENARPSIKITGVRINSQRRRARQVEVPVDVEPLAKTLLPDGPTEEDHPGTETDPGTDDQVGISCPPHAIVVAPGHCECESGFHLDTLGTSCVPSYENPLLAQSMAMNYASRAL